MFEPAKIIEKAKRSAFWRWVLTQSLYRMVPFNSPHRFAVVEIGDDRIKTRIPYIRKNLNHIRGLHACALATISEFATGFLLLARLDMKKYRLIMQRIEIDYHYQGKMEAFAEFSAPDQWLQERVIIPLQTNDAVVIPCEIKIHDAKGNHLTTGKVF